jgi:hypothetical protein
MRVPVATKGGGSFGPFDDTHGELSMRRPDTQQPRAAMASEKGPDAHAGEAVRLRR